MSDPAHELPADSPAGSLSRTRIGAHQTVGGNGSLPSCPNRWLRRSGLRIHDQNGMRRALGLN
jgi:hypothetical protein